MTEEFQRTSPLGKDVEPLEVYTEHAEIRKQVYGEIKKLLVTLDNSSPSFKVYNSRTVYKFLNCMVPLKNLHDPGRLPVCTFVPKSTVRDKRSCVWAVVSCLVQAYWKYELDDTEDSKVEVGILLSNLRAINDCYPEMKIAGAENKGYWLELD